MNFHRNVEQIRHQQRKEPELRPETRQADADALLAELKRLLDEDPTPPVASVSVASAPRLTLPEPRQSQQQVDIPEVSIIGAVDAAADVQARTPDLHEIIGPDPYPGDHEARFRPRTWKLLASGLALSVAAATVAGFVLTRGVPSLPKNSASVVATPAPTDPRLQSADTVAPPNAAGGSLVKDVPPPERLRAGGSAPNPDAKAAPANSASPPAGATPAVDAGAPEDQGSHATTAAATADASAAANPPAATATAVSQPQRQELAPEIVKPDEAPSATGSLTSNSTGASESSGPVAPKPEHTKPSSTTAVSAEPAPPSPPKNALSKRAHAGKKADHKSAAKKKATTAAMAEASRQRVQPATPKATTTEQATTDDPAAAAPAAPAAAQAAPAEQPSGGLPGALGYLVHLPGALIQQVTNPNSNPK